MLPQFLRNREIFKDGKFLQILILSFSFMLLFTAFQTTCFIEQTVLKSVQLEDPSFSGDGYVSLCIIYAVFALGSWVAPSIVAVIRSKWSMVISASLYVLFIVQFTFPTTWVLYVTSALLGAGASLLWCAQGNFLTLCSDSNTISRNSGVFWAINQCSLFFGNLFVFFQFNGKDRIDAETRSFVFIVLTVIAICGVALFLLLDNVTEKSAKPEDGTQPSSEIGLSVAEKAKAEEETKTSSQKAIFAFIQAFKLFLSPYMILLSIASIYTGWGQSFFFGVYSTAVGNTKLFGDAKKLVGLIGIFTGIGEVAGGALFGILGSKTTKRGRSPIVFLGLIIHTLCYVLIYLNNPNRSTIEETDEASFISPPWAWLAVLCALLLGFGDACYQTQLFAIFGSVYSDKSAAAFAIFKFTQSLASAVAFFSTSFMGIFDLVITLFTFAVLGFFGILIVEKKTKNKEVEKANGSEKDSSESGIGTNAVDGPVPSEGSDLGKTDANENSA